MRKVNNTTLDLIEIIKYGVKIFTDPEMKKNAGRNRAKIYVKAQFNILDAFHNHRIFDRFGFNLPQTEKAINPPRNLTNYEKFEFDLKRHDWVDTETDEVLTKYLPDENLIQILTHQIDTERE